MSDERLILEVALEDDASPGLQRVDQKVQALDRSTRNAERSARGLGGGLTNVKGGLQGLGGPLGNVDSKLSGLVTRFGSLAASAGKAGVALGGALVAGAAAGGLALLNLASDAGETTSKFNTVFGESTQVMSSFVDKLHSQSGIARTDLQNFASTFGVFGQAAGVAPDALSEFSARLTETTLDLASFYNARPEDVALAMRSGLAGEAEPLRQFGIFLSESSMQAQAAAMGLTGELTEQQKVLVRHALIQQQLGSAEGDLARTQDSVANQMRRVQGIAKELATTLGTALTPAAQALLPVLGDGLASATERVSAALPALQERAQRAAEGLMGFADQVRDLVGQVRDQGLTATLEGLLPPAALNVFREGKAVLDDLATVFRDLLVPVLGSVTSALPAFLTPLGLARELLGFVADNALTLQPILAGLLAGFLAYRTVVVVTQAWAVAQKALNLVMSMNPIGLVVVAIAALAAGLIYAYNHSETFRETVDRAWAGIKGATQAVVDFGLQAWQWMRDAWDRTKEGALSLASTAVGAFRNLVDFFLGMVDTIVQGAATAFSWVPGLGPKLQEAATRVSEFRTSANESLSAIERNLAISADTSPARAEVEKLRKWVEESNTTMRISGVNSAGGITMGDGFGIPGAGGGRLGPAAGWSAQWREVKAAFPGSQLHSGYRPGAITATGNPSYHGKGRAVDLTPSMAIFNWIKANYGAISKEIIFSPAGAGQVWNGRNHMYSGVTRSNHWDHVHWALAGGGLVEAGQSYLVGERGREFLLSDSGVTLVGEHGPELIRPSERGEVVPNTITERALSGVGASASAVAASGPSGDVNVSVAVNGTVFDVGNLRDEIEATTQRVLDRQRRDAMERSTRWQR